MITQTFSSNIRRKEMEAVLTCMVIGVSQVVMSVVRGAIYLYSKYSNK